MKSHLNRFNEDGVRLMMFFMTPFGIAELKQVAIISIREIVLELTRKRSAFVLPNAMGH